ncbi:MAG: type VII toxin-antitoxin system MntA family adenylyltransferase antitoxin [Anaerolineae bacterium]
MSPVDDETRAYTHPPVLDEAGLIAFLATQPDVIAAYLFGSLAQGRAHPRSDIDVAVLLTPMDPEAAFYRRLRLMEQLRPYADREVDVIVLNLAPPLLQHQVLKYGRLLYERDKLARADFEVRAGKVYADLKPIQDLFAQVLSQEIKEVGLGGRRRRPTRTTRIST